MERPSISRGDLGHAAHQVEDFPYRPTKVVDSVADVADVVDLVAERAVQRG